MPARELLAKLSEQHAGIAFVGGNTFMWSPAKQEVHYDTAALESTEGSYSLLHELAHALLVHKSYRADTELIQLEIQAWAKAQELAESHSFKIPEDHIQDCLDSYRDWLLKRATCPDCHVAGLQSTKNLEYECLNCGKTWTVPADQTCTPRRSTTN